MKILCMCVAGNNLFCCVHCKLHNDAVITSQKFLPVIFLKNASVAYTSTSENYAFQINKNHQISEIFINLQYKCVG